MWKAIVLVWRKYVERWQMAWGLAIWIVTAIAWPAIKDRLGVSGPDWLLWGGPYVIAGTASCLLLWSASRRIRKLEKWRDETLALMEGTVKRHDETRKAEAIELEALQAALVTAESPPTLEDGQRVLHEIGVRFDRHIAALAAADKDIERAIGALDRMSLGYAREAMNRSNEAIANVKSIMSATWNDMIACLDTKSSAYEALGPSVFEASCNSSAPSSDTLEDWTNYRKQVADIREGLRRLVDSDLKLRHVRPGFRAWPPQPESGSEPSL